MRAHLHTNTSIHSTHRHLTRTHQGGIVAGGPHVDVPAGRHCGLHAPHQPHHRDRLRPGVAHEERAGHLQRPRVARVPAQHRPRDGACGAQPGPALQALRAEATALWKQAGLEGSLKAEAPDPQGEKNSPRNARALAKKN